MKIVRFIILIALLSASSVLAYKTLWETPCDTTIEYTIGNFDERFGISKDAFIALVERAESAWETASGKNLFQYTEGADFKIHLNFGDEQNRIQKGDGLLGGLDSVQEKLEQGKRNYESKLRQYKKQEGDYKNALRRYEQEVNSWNTKGGAPKEVFDALKIKKENLDKVFLRLKKLQREINTLVEKNNKEIKNYNKGVQEYNTLFEDGKEFDAGNANRKEINIYSYKSEEELYSVLVHEFGHVLGLEHAEKKDSVMYYLLNQQNSSGKLSQEDIFSLQNLCRLKLTK